jgi:hypothetical protein
MMSRLLIYLAAALVAASCSSGGSGNDAMPPASPGTKMAQVRLVNAATRLGSLTFAWGTNQAQVPIRSASGIVAVPVGTFTFSVTNGTVSATRSISIADGASVDVVAYESPAGALSLESIFGQVVAVDATKALVTYFNFAEALSSPGDAYIVPAGADINPLAPTFQAGGGSLPFAPGSYEVVLTPFNSKAIFYRSVAFTLAAGEQLVLISAPASASVVTPQPIEVVFGQPSAELDNAMVVTVKVLRRLDTVPAGENEPSTLQVDGGSLQMPAPNDASNFSYGLAPGSHYFVSLSSIGFNQQFPANSRYVQRFGWYAVGAVSSRDSWLPPDPAPDYPVPNDRARVHLVVEQTLCSSDAVKVDGADVSYPDQTWGNSGIAFDHAPGAISIQAGVGTTTLDLKPGHYYFVRAMEFNFVEFPPGNCGHRTFEISGDE